MAWKKFSISIQEQSQVWRDHTDFPRPFFMKTGHFRNNALVNLQDLSKDKQEIKEEKKVK